MSLASQAPAREDAPRWFPQRSALVFCAPMIVNGTVLPFFPVWLETHSLNDHQIGVILAVPMVVRVIFAPILAMFADRMEERTGILVWSGLLCLATAVALFWTQSFWPILLVFALQGAVFAPYIPVVESMLITGVRRWGFDYGSMRLWASLAFIASTLVGGHLIGLYGGAMVLPVMTVGCIVMSAMGLAAPRIGRVPRRAVAATGKSGQRASLSRFDLHLVMIGSSVVQAGHAMLYAFASIYWAQLGYSGTAVGILWSAGVLAEVIAFFFARQLSRTFGAWTLIRFGATIAVCRWLLFPLDIGYLGYFVLQCLHAFTFAFCHIGIQRRIVDAVHEEQEASAQGAYYFYNGIFMAAATFASGYIYAAFGLHGYYVMSAIAAVGLGCVIVAWYLQPQRAGSGGKTSESR
ncbi:MFS transporter [Rhizobium sp. LjRoot30]|uniref:MFS transporter n=1 Tax=Rhizobium sp. LjRoot30 TaxID=3342320 RepID=UPI003ED16D61